MIQKITAILGSIRFWEIVCALILALLIQTKVIDNETAITIVQSIIALLGVSVTIGTVDKFSANIGGK
jgi:hypothetical protein